MCVYNPLNKQYKSRTGAIRAGEELTLRVKGNFNSVVLVYRKDGENLPLRAEMRKMEGFFECTVALTKGLYWYCFDLNNGFFIGEGNKLCGVVTEKPKEFQLTVYSEDYAVPEWIYGGIIYQIFPDRFNVSEKGVIAVADRAVHSDKSVLPVFLPNENGKVLNNDFFGGNLAGITEKLDYLYSLGVTAIYLNPIFKAYSNHRYDTGDYMSIDEMLGDENDFKNLISKAEERGIKIILDGVFNHTGDDSIYFDKYKKYGANGAYSNADSPYKNWFKFIRYPDLYESWWGVSTLPATNKNDAGFTDFITGENGVLNHYTRLGIGGWRLDVVDELPANFVQRIRTAVKRVNSQAIIIGEVWENATDKISYGVRREYFQGAELDSVMNYPLKDAILKFVKEKDSEALSEVIARQTDAYPDFVLHAAMNVLATHDTFRLLSAVGDFDATGKSKRELSEVVYEGERLKTAVLSLKIAVLLQYTLKGVPSVYYGDEIGMQGFSDPLNRKFYDWAHADIKIREWYSKLGKIRRSYSAFGQGEYNELYAKNGAFVFERISEDSELLIAVNSGEKERKIEFSGKLKNLMDGEIYENIIALTQGFAGIFARVDE